MLGRPAFPWVFNLTFPIRMLLERCLLTEVLFLGPVCQVGAGEAGGGDGDHDHPVHRGVEAREGREQAGHGRSVLSSVMVIYFIDFQGVTASELRDPVNMPFERSVQETCT